MARYWCERCGQESNTLDPPHLCKDLKRRWEHRERLAAAAQAELYGKVLDTVDTEALAKRLVERLLRMGLTNDV